LSFLHQQEMLLINTADNLARMARETLVYARSLLSLSLSLSYSAVDDQLLVIWQWH